MTAPSESPEERLAIEFRSKFDAEVWAGKSDAKQLDDGSGNTVVSVWIRPSKTVPSG
jgi:hypothetical protein